MSGNHQNALLSNANPDLLAALVENEKCALILGPFANTDPHGVPLRQLLANDIAQEYSKITGATFPEPDNLPLVSTAFLQLPDTPRLSLEIIIRKFYKRHQEPSTLLQEIAKLPFPVIFTTSHDTLLQRAFLTAQKRQFREGVYRLATNQNDNYKETPPGQTYIYQLFGQVSDHSCDAAILSTDDQLRYIDSIQGVGNETRLPPSLRNAMRAFDAFIFLGFDYEYWYLKVLFHILDISASERTKLIFGIPEGLSKDLSAGSEAFFRQQYRFKFLRDNPLELLQNISQRVQNSQSDQSAPTAPAGQSLLYLNAVADQSITEKLDRYLSTTKRQYGLVAKNLQEVPPGDDVQAAHYALIDAACTIVIVISSDLIADNYLFDKLVQHALKRQSATVCVVAVYARETTGVADAFKNQVVLMSASVPLSWMDEATGLTKIAEQIEQRISVLK